jgi:hypothetical protein
MWVWIPTVESIFTVRPILYICRALLGNDKKEMLIEWKLMAFIKVAENTKLEQLVCMPCKPVMRFISIAESGILELCFLR